MEVAQTLTGEAQTLTGVAQTLAIRSVIKLNFKNTNASSKSLPMRDLIFEQKNPAIKIARSGTTDVGRIVANCN